MILTYTVVVPNTGDQNYDLEQAADKVYEQADLLTETHNSDVRVKLLDFYSFYSDGLYWQFTFEMRTYRH